MKTIRVKATKAFIGTTTFLRTKRICDYGSCKFKTTSFYSPTS